MAIRRLRSLLVPLAAVLASSALAPTVSAAEESRPDDRVALSAAAPADDGWFLQDAARGATAVQRLGDDLAQVARLNGMSAEAFAELLTSDRTAWVHPNGLLYYVDPAPDDIVAEAPTAAPYPYSQTFELHSKPDSTKTIYLDFDGHYVGGTDWNNDPNSPMPARLHPAFSLDGDPTTFNNSERDLIQSVWQRVSEDYAPFDVDVTTADPGPAGLVRDFDGDPVFGTRALITPSLTAAHALCSNQCGGIAFMSTFDTGRARFQPAWIFPHNLGFDTKAIAEAVSHEVGHNLGLDHDGAPGQGYYPGHGAWAPIMGGSYDRPISQWSRGEYHGATNTEDDLSVITANGLSYRPDDHGNDATGATPLPSTGGPVPGLITTRSDKDYFAFPQGCAGTVTLSAVPAPTSPNLDIRLRVLTGDGISIATDNPASAFSTEDVATGLAAGTTVTAVSGTPLFVEVDGVGAGSAATNGYSDYASIGRYTLTASGCGGGTDAVAVAFQQSTLSAGEAADEALLTVVRTGDTSGTSSVGYARTGGSATPGNDFTLAAGTLSFAAGETQKSIRVAITDDSVDEVDETVVVTLSSPSTGTTLGSVTSSTLTISDNDEVAPAAAQPDLRISTRKASGYIGDNVYNENGAGQTRQSSAPRGQLRSFFVEVTNDGSEAERFTLFGTASRKGSKVTYLSGGNDLTAAMTGTGGAWVVLAPDQYALIRVDIKIGRKAAVGATKSALVSAVSKSGLGDVVAAAVKVVRR